MAGTDRRMIKLSFLVNLSTCKRNHNIFQPFESLMEKVKEKPLGCYSWFPNQLLLSLAFVCIRCFEISHVKPRVCCIFNPFVDG